MELYPLFVLLVGIIVVIGMIVGCKANAFVALILAAIVVSLMSGAPDAADVAEKAPGLIDEAGNLKPGYQITLIATVFGNTAGKIAIVIALAAIIGKCLMESGAADRIVRNILGVFGEKRSATALGASGFVLSIPVFFDTVFYLLVPLARSLYRSTKSNYLLYILAIGAGAAVTHTLVPPTPGPLAAAAELNVDFGAMMLVGLIVAVPATAAGLVFAIWCNAKMPIKMRPIAGEEEAFEATPDSELPPFLLSMLPIVLPVILIASNTILSNIAKVEGSSEAVRNLSSWFAILGNPNFALLIAAAAAVAVYIKQIKPSLTKVGEITEQALMSAGVIILITAAGGAFGGMLQFAGVGAAIESLFGTSAGGQSSTSGLVVLCLAFGVAVLIKIAQGSTTVAMITTPAIIAPMFTPETLGFHAVYLVTTIGGGGLVGSWMNDSGFWIFAKMGGLKETETLRSWTPMLVVLGFTMFAVSFLLALLLPFPI